MKRLHLIFVLFPMLVPVGMRGGKVKELDFHYDLNDFIIKEKDEMVKVQVSP